MSATTDNPAMAAERLTEARRTLDTHITSTTTGRCLACGTHGPCYKRENAVVIFSRATRMPFRQSVVNEVVPAPRAGVAAQMSSRV